MTNKETIKSWFRNGAKPTEKQFWAWMDSFFHKKEKIPMESVEGMDEALEGKAEVEILSNHLNDEHAHKEIFNEKVDKEFGKGLSTNDFTNALKTKLEGLNNADLSPYLEKGGYSGTAQNLKNQIDSILSILNSQDTSLDDFNEIVTFIKQNKKHLDELAVDNIAGLQDVLNAKADVLHHHDERYYNRQEIDNLLLYKVNDGDSRLRDPRPASDVHSWAKATNKPTYTYDEIINKPNNLVTIGDLKEAIDGIIIGGTNLVKNSNKEISKYNFIVDLTEPLVEGDVYTFSFEAKGDLQGKIFLNKSVILPFPKANTLEYKRFSVTFVYKRNDYHGRQISPHVYGATHVRNLKLERGTKPTDWTPSPADFFHKEEKIPMQNVEGMDEALEGKAEVDLLDNKADLDNGKLRLSQMPEHPLISRNEEKNITAIGTSKRAIIAPEYLKNSLFIGTNVAPVITGAPDNNNGNYSQGYILTGLDILPNFVGNTSYNPTHPAHDSHVVYGRDIGRGIVDADNLTAFGTALFSRNDVPIALHNTVIGNNITNAKKSGINPNRAVTASNGFNLRTALAGNVLVGNYIWADDFHSSTIVGQSAKHFRYAFNSVVIGNDNQNFNGVKYPGESRLVDYLDNDVIIGNGLHKDPKRHAPTHNLIIGSTEGYGCGGWNQNYIPLVEGNFKDEWLQVNGTLGIQQRKPEQHQAPMEQIPLSLISVPNGANGKVSYDEETGEITLTNAPAGRYVLARNVDVGKYLFDMAPSGITGGRFNLRALHYSFDGATTYQYRNVLTNATAGGNREFAFELVGTVSGKLSVKLTKIIANKTVAPSFISEDVDGQTNFEARFGKASGNFIALGRNTGTSFYANKPREGDILIGNGTATKTVSFESNVMIGNGTARNPIQSRFNVLIGNYILATSTEDNHRNVIVGDKAAASAALINRSVILGAAALVGFNTNGTEIHAIGEGVGRTITRGRRFIVIGRDGAFGTANLTDSICLVPDTDGGKKSFGNNPTVTNAIVISGKGINGHGSNTTTIGNPDTQEAHIYGKMNLYKPLKLARYTQAQIRALSSNAEEGDLVYQTDADKGIKMFDGSVWVGLALAYP